MQCYSGSPILYLPSGYFYIEETFLSSAIIDNETYGKDQVETVRSAMTENGFFAFTITNDENTHNHNYIEINREEATCQHEGYIYYQCTECGDTYTEVLPMVNHHYVETNRKEPTCTEDGYVS